MKDFPIIFSGPMVRANHAGRKRMTRRVVKPQPLEVVPMRDAAGQYTYQYGLCMEAPRVISKTVQSPYGIPGARIWVRETLCMCFQKPTGCYRADGAGCSGPGPWTPSIHMPRCACRDVYTVTNVRMERLQAITEEDAIAEGIYEIKPGGWLWTDPEKTNTPNMTLAHTPRQAFMWLWDAINGKRPGCSWVANPWVWVVEYENPVVPS